MRLHLDNHLRLTAEVAQSPNLTSHFGPDDLARIGEAVWSGYDQDESSRGRWLERNRAAMELALQIQETKTYPWPNASNIAFPLLTISAVQFHSRAYPSLLGGPNIVKYRVPGIDQRGELDARASLVARYMSYQVLEQDGAFEEQHDRLLIHIPIVGCGFVKTRWNPAAGHPVSEFIPAQDLVIDYFAKSIDSALRKTQILTLYRNEVWERCVAGVFRDITDEAWYANPGLAGLPPGSESRDKVSGRQLSPETMGDALYFLEQHCWLDLDGDGYSEPYIVTMARDAKKVVRIVARWERPEDIEYVGRKILRIRPTEYYTKFDLIPSPDGGIYGIGFGSLLGPLNESVNSTVNMLIDAGHLSVAAGGFLGRGARLRSGQSSFDPFGWNQVESSGDDLRKNLVSLPVREPSNVLFQLLTLLINYTQRISGATDVMVGENPGQNTPAHNMQAMVEEGTKIYTAIFQRIWKQLKNEFGKIYVLNGRHLPEKLPFGEGVVGREMFLDDPSRVVPAADPRMSSASARLQKALTLKQSAMSTQGYDPEKVERKFLHALDIDDIDVIYPGPGKVPPLKNPKIQIEEMKSQVRMKEMELELQRLALEMAEEKRLNNAKILELEAKAVKLMSDAGGADAAHSLKVLEAQLGMLRDHNEAVSRRLEVMMKGMNGFEGSNSGVARPPSNGSVPAAPPVASPILNGGLGSGGFPGGH